VKAIRIKKELKEAGFLEEQISKLACPLGLPIGDNTPSEMAISICSQLLAVRDKKTFQLDNGVLLWK
jgi:xanthine dehydrogenase accessory factor